ncbi:MAG: hypothetical protein V4622_00140 [Bacteroidota bacterium]
MILKVLNIYLIRYNFFIAFCSICVLFYFSILTENKISPFYYLFTFFGTLALYNLFRLSPSFSGLFKKQSMGFSHELIFVSLIICAISFFLIPSNTKYFYLIPIFLSSLYQFSIFGLKNLRTFPYFKIMIIAFVWVLMALIPFLEYKFTQEKLHNFYFLTLTQFLFFLSLAIPFDVFDEQKDEIKTLAKMLGAKKAIYLSLFFLLIYLVLHLIENSSFQEKIAYSTITLTSFVTLMNYKRMKAIASQYYFIDGLIVVQTAIIFLVHK